MLAKISNPSLDTAKSTIQINAKYKCDFAKASNFIAASIIPLNSGKEDRSPALSKTKTNSKVVLVEFTAEVAIVVMVAVLSEVVVSQPMAIKARTTKVEVPIKVMGTR